MKKECYKFAPIITGYIDGELKSTKKIEVQAHLDNCPECYNQYLNEMKVKKMVKEKLPILKAPVYLHRRIRRQLLRKGERPGFWELIQSIFIYRPVSASFALAVLAFLIIFPTYQIMLVNLNRDSTQVSEVKGQIICVDCEFLSKSNEKFHHDPATHRSGLKTEDGTIWSFLPTVATKDLLHNQKYLRKKVRVYGTLFNNSRFIYVKEFDIL